MVENFIEVSLKEKEDFLKVKETLTRIGVASKKDNVLYQSCHILHKQSKYYIVHFKELFLLDGKTADFNEGDISRRNTIANLLAEWNLVELVNPLASSMPLCDLNQIKIIPFKEKNLWTLEAKYTIGKKR